MKVTTAILSRITLGLTTLLYLASCTPSEKKEQAKVDKPSIDSLFTQYGEDYLKFSPLEASMQGDNRYDDLLPNVITAEYRQQVKDFYTSYQGKLAAYKDDSLTADQRMSYDVLTWECNMALEGLEYKAAYLLPVNQFFDYHLIVGQLASGQSFHPFKTVKDYDNWLSRLNAYIAWCDSAIVNMQTGIKEGYTLPRPLVEKTIPQFEGMAKGPLKDHLYYQPIVNLPASFSPEDKARLTKAYEDMVTQQIIPIHKKVADFLKSEYLPAARKTSGIGDLPDGKKYYDYLIKYFTTTTKSADEIFALGKSEVERISKEMEAVKAQVGYKGDLKSFLVSLRTRKELTPYSKPEQVIASFNEIHERMEPNLNKLFDKKPKTQFEVRRTEAFREATAAAQYMSGSKDGSRPGVFYVPIPSVKEYNIMEDEDLFLHEAIPGHHYQVSLQMENTNLPTFRNLVNYSAYSEGWGLYAESLGKELGLYSDPYQYLGMLGGEIHRAIRLVVDAGMHTQGWTREQAIQYSKDHESSTDQAIIAEIERYMAYPGQALSYKIGQLKIRELRSKAEKELGDKFSIAEFHNEVLEPGCIPLQMLEAKIDEWIASKK